MYLRQSLVWPGDAYPDLPDTLSFKDTFFLLSVLVSLDMVHAYMFPKAIVSEDVNPVEVKYDVKPDEVNDDVKPGVRLVVVEVDVPEHMLQ